MGARIRRWREDRGWTQQRLADWVAKSHGINWHQTTVGKIESGERPLKLAEAVAVAEALLLTVDELLEDEPRVDNALLMIGGAQHELALLSDYVDRRRDELGAAEREIEQAGAYHLRTQDEKADDEHREEA